MAVLPVQVIDMWSNSQRIHPVSERPVLSCFPCSQRHTTVLRLILDAV